MKAAAIVRQNGGKVILDPAPAPEGGYSADVYQQIDVITPNETETELLTGLRPTNEAEAAEAAQRLLDKGVGLAVVKLGANGVLYKTASEQGFVTPFKVDSIDSVAAGDCFNGGSGLCARGRTLHRRCRALCCCLRCPVNHQTRGVQFSSAA